MGKYIDKLLSISCDSFVQEQANLTSELRGIAGNLAQELEALLNKKNGFFAFESALRVFSSCSSQLSIGLDDWNSEALWRKDYNGLADGCLFFAEDIFGGQFCIKNGVVCAFDPETAGLEEMAASIEQWAQEILNEYNVWTGYSLAHVWQEHSGALSSELRLMPKTPFVCGGQFELDNLIAINAVSGMKSRANLACQIVDLPDGAQIEFKIIE
ncbi:SMI1/KNR4 family protein [Pseudoalteromonas rubra]|uniref:SMI1/KNR4 family protein n=1 Tax=Pseudoalteromonas rubra TaxID=43658 RepID=A0A4Q7E078_9GAMM|nr:SMI1/KNR4 family protein [Pseudoalteromonas rubra]RZM74389.1 SMI1/KNR4 family protein [Pseudoalteromonas rubra]